MRPERWWCAQTEPILTRSQRISPQAAAALVNDRTRLTELGEHSEQTRQARSGPRIAEAVRRGVGRDAGRVNRKGSDLPATEAAARNVGKTLLAAVWMYGGRGVGMLWTLAIISQLSIGDYGLYGMGFALASIVGPPLDNPFAVRAARESQERFLAERTTRYLLGLGLMGAGMAFVERQLHRVVRLVRGRWRDRVQVSTKARPSATGIPRRYGGSTRFNGLRAWRLPALTFSASSSPAFSREHALLRTVCRDGGFRRRAGDAAIGPACPGRPG